MKYEYRTEVTKEDFMKALSETNLLNIKEFDLLAAHYQLEGHQATATQLAKLTNKTAHSVINIEFAKIAKKIANYIKKYPPIRTDGTYRWWALLANGEEFGKHFIWKLKPELVEAMSELSIFNEPYTYYPEEVVENRKVFIEGAIKKITVNAYERNVSARLICVDHYGFNCSVCDFNFKKIYGLSGENYIHVHHLRPISEIGKNYEVDPIKDLRPVCPNCHAMLHRNDSIISIEELKSRINNSKQQKNENI